MQFEEMNIINSSLNLVYPRKIKIQEKFQSTLPEINQIIEDYYLPPNFIPVPEEIDPEIPRVVINAINGHNQLVFSQINSKIDANFDYRYQRDVEKCFQYLQTRSELLMGITDCLNIQETLFQGLTFSAQFPQVREDQEITRYLANTFNRGLNSSLNINDFNQKITFVIDNEHYINIVIGNYRNYNFTNRQDNSMTSSIAEAKLLEKGIFISLDINNRYFFNQTGDTNNSLKQSVNRLFEFSLNFFLNNATQILKEGEFKL